MKIMIRNYTFDASLQKITFDDYASINLEEILLVTNTTDGAIIYQFNSATKGGTVATNVLTLTYDTTAMDDADSLQIFYDDPGLSPSIDSTHVVAVAWSGANLEYFGRALPGSSQAGALWQIRKFTYSGSYLTDVQWADGDTLYDNVWDDRAGLSYS